MTVWDGVVGGLVSGSAAFAGTWVTLRHMRKQRFEERWDESLVQAAHAAAALGWTVAGVKSDEDLVVVLEDFGAMELAHGILRMRAPDRRHARVVDVLDDIWLEFRTCIRDGLVDRREDLMPEGELGVTADNLLTEYETLLQIMINHVHREDRPRRGESNEALRDRLTRRKEFRPAVIEGPAQ